MVWAGRVREMPVSYPRFGKFGGTPQGGLALQGGHMARRAMGPGPRALIALCTLAAASGLWGLFLWLELMSSRQGGEIFCPLGRLASCATLWDSVFANAVHAGTGLPIAGWGLVWGLVGAAVTAGLLRARQSALLRGALVATAVAGAVAVLSLLAASAAVGAICGNCLVTYVLVGGFVTIVFATTRGLALAELARGAAAATALAGVVFVLLLTAGMRTPVGTTRGAGIADLGQGGIDLRNFDERLESFVAGLGPDERRELAKALIAYAEGPSPALRPARKLNGSPSAPVRLTDFTDTLCSHCADFHAVVEELQRALPPPAFSLEERHFPLDAACNRAGPPREPGVSVRCRAALARICMEDTQHAFDYSGDLFRNQEALSAELVLSLAAPYTDLGSLERCMDSQETQAKLREDINWALEHRLRGTPLVLINGRRAPTSPGFLYAMILARGRVHHRAFEGLTTAVQAEP